MNRQNVLPTSDYPGEIRSRERESDQRRPDRYLDIFTFLFQFYPEAAIHIGDLAQNLQEGVQDQEEEDQDQEEDVQGDQEDHALPEDLDLPGTEGEGILREEVDEDRKPFTNLIQYAQF